MNVPSCMVFLSVSWMFCITFKPHYMFDILFLLFLIAHNLLYLTKNVKMVTSALIIWPLNC